MADKKFECECCGAETTEEGLCESCKSTFASACEGEGCGEEKEEN